MELKWFKKWMMLVFFSQGKVASVIEISGVRLSVEVRSPTSFKGEISSRK